MKRLSVSLLTVLLTMGCEPTTAPTTDPATITALAQASIGSSFKTAIVIKATNEIASVAAEYEWVRVNRPGWKVVEQSLVANGNKTYDVLTLTKAGESADIYFDITGFFGKF